MNSFSDDDLLRPGQLGTLHALKAHFLGSHKKSVAQVHLPTGYGKTMVMLLAKHTLSEGRQTLVVCGTEVLREQLRRNFAAFANEKAEPADAIPHTATIARQIIGLRNDTPSPDKSVFTKVGVDDNDSPPANADVVVALPQSLNTYSPKDESGQQAVGLILIDEGHHVPAKTWAEIVKRNPSAKVVVFTATPFRRDGLPLPGRLVFTYALTDAIQEGSITDATIHSVEVSEGDEALSSDEKLATRAIEVLRQCQTIFPQAKLLIKCGDIERCEQLAYLYKRMWGDNDAEDSLLVLHSKLTAAEIRTRLNRLDNSEFVIAAAVNMLSEGLDNPNIRVLAVHDNLPDLGHFVQVAGRVSRAVASDTKETQSGGTLPKETSIDSHVILSKDHLPEALRETSIPKKLSDLSSAVAGRIFNEELRTWLQEHLGEGPIPAETVHSIFQNARLREYVRIYELRTGDAIDWSHHLGAPNRLSFTGYYSSASKSGKVQVGLAVTKKPNAWLGDLNVPTATAGLVLTYEPTPVANTNIRLFFVTATPEHRDFIDLLVESLNSQGAKIFPLGLLILKHLYSDHEHVTYFNLGLRSRVRSPLVERYRIIAGTEIELALDSDVAHGFAQGHVIGRMFDTDDSGAVTGVPEILGISARSTVWGGGTRKADALCEAWMLSLAKRIWGEASTLPSALEQVPTGASVDLATLPTGVGSVGFWGHKTIVEGVTLVSGDGSHATWNNVYLGQAYVDNIKVSNPDKVVTFDIKFASGAPAKYPKIEVSFDPFAQSFDVTPAVKLCRTPDDVLTLASWLRIDPPALFLRDGSCLQGRDLIPPSPAGNTLEFIRNSLFTMNWIGCDVGMEKPPGFEPDKTKKTDPAAAPQTKIKNYDPRLRGDTSIFTYVANELIARVEKKKLIAAFCDDDAYEIADFIAFRTEGDKRLVVELYLCKKTNADEPGLRTLEVAELWAQALRASQLLTKESLSKHILKREMSRMIMAPAVKDAKDLVGRLLEERVLIEFEIILVQPGLDLSKLTPEISSNVNSKNTIAHALASLSATFKKRGVNLLIVGRTSKVATTTKKGKGKASVKPTFPDIFLRSGM